MLLEVASKLLAQGTNYMKCTHVEDPKKLKEYCEPERPHLVLARICPRPDTDPSLVCQVNKWYLAQHGQHEETLDGIDKFPSFARGKYQTGVHDLLMQSYDHYERYGNRNVNYGGEGAFPGEGMQGIGFHLPTCVSEYVHLSDWSYSNPYKNTPWNFPSVCGDHHANETEDFMQAININDDTYKAAAQLFKDRIPRVSWQLSLRYMTFLLIVPKQLHDLPPYDHYMALCKLGIKYPQHHDGAKPLDRNQMRLGKDRDCDMVTELTQYMPRDVANDWFCRGPEGAAIVERERPYLYMPSLNPQFYGNHGDMCKRWNAGERMAGPFKHPNNPKHPRLDVVIDAALWKEPGGLPTPMAMTMHATLGHSHHAIGGINGTNKTNTTASARPRIVPVPLRG